MTVGGDNAGVGAWREDLDGGPAHPQGHGRAHEDGAEANQRALVDMDQGCPSTPSEQSAREAQAAFFMTMGAASSARGCCSAGRWAR